jgi:hypothetical protein
MAIARKPQRDSTRSIASADTRAKSSLSIFYWRLSEAGLHQTAGSLLLLVDKQSVRLAPHRCCSIRPREISIKFEAFIRTPTTYA